MKKKRRKNCGELKGNRNPDQQCQIKAPSWRPAVVAPYCSVVAPCGTPDVPVGQADLDPHPPGGEVGGDHSQFASRLKLVAGEAGVRSLRFVYPLTEKRSVEWSAVQWAGKLYVHPPPGMLAQGGRDSLVELLDFAQDKLGCSHVFVAFDKNRIDRAALIKTFMYLGFISMVADHPCIPQGADPDLMFMAYIIDNEDNQSLLD